MSSWTTQTLLALATIPIVGSAYGERNLFLGPPGFSEPALAPSLAPSAYTAGPIKSVWKEGYYNNPTGTAEQPQPRVTDPVSGRLFDQNLSSPVFYPRNNTQDPAVFPPTPPADQLYTLFLNQLTEIIETPSFGGGCGSCLAAFQVGQVIALTNPHLVTDLLVSLCEKYQYQTDCRERYYPSRFGAIITQVLANANLSGYGGQIICSQFFLNTCSHPPPPTLNLSSWFSKPKPLDAAAPIPSTGGKKLKILHISDLHLDVRYATGSEAQCASGLCCRLEVDPTKIPEKPIFPAPRYGAFECDTPLSLALAALESIPVLTDTKEGGFDFSIYTGDLVSHDEIAEQSRDYTHLSEVLVYELLRQQLNSGPIYVAVGNHDSSPTDQVGPTKASDYLNTLDKGLAEQFNYHYEYLSKLWSHEGWLNDAASQLVRTHYGGYSVQRGGLRIITFNTDYCKYPPNYYNYINPESSDSGGALRFLTDELQAAEDTGQRAWIIGHVPSGWDGTNTMHASSNLCIVDRFSPHVIAGIFYGHTHEDQFMVYYANNGSVISGEHALAAAWMVPSLTPLGNLNSGFRMYEVDAETYEIIDAHTWYSNVSSYPGLDSQAEHGPTYTYEYSAREVYGKNISWPGSAPLNATWWHRVTEQMEANPDLVETFTTYQGKRSVRTPSCVSKECVAAKICYMRSGSAPIARQNCIPGYGSVQHG
ncbi:uncharacterized protein EI90DRAFT_2906259 [Cantharellus anzutake]|uniref:uncharacterized protein n=1 Tax=Cantharellus anzutake TaxID=1750568 RepID=UPI0019081E6B|nr:uncharacterized protein EI90DRAFT_2906259 [Cantharellus anzutake]KAF8340731.1 hypothetical protein EI90DRAFT_2906259 [Cantharellus anzutake]